MALMWNDFYVTMPGIMSCWMLQAIVLTDIASDVTVRPWQCSDDDDKERILYNKSVGRDFGSSSI
jgi:hypothetical protein